VSQFPAIGGSPQINGLKTYITTNRVLRMLALDSNGNLYKETSPGTLALITPGGVTPSLYLASTTLFGREYMGFGDGITGQDMPRQFDDTYFDRVSQIGPAESPAVADSTGAGNISPGVHQCAVVFVTRQGYWTAPSPPISWTAAGGHQVAVTNIPTGPSNVVQRLLVFTGVGRREFLSRAVDHGDQRQHDYVAHGRLHRHDPALRHEHGLPLQPDRIARAVGRGRVRRAAFLVGRARSDG
jgi:hypothetical protein